jgi:hypothetical protein
VPKNEKRFFHYRAPKKGVLLKKSITGFKDAFCVFLDI